MFNPVTKAARYLRREYPFLASLSGTMFGIGAGISVVGALAIPGTPLLLPLLLPVGMGVGGLGLAAAGGGEFGRPSSNSAEVNGTKIVGAVSDVASICMTQKLITSYTEKLQHREALPPRLQRKIAQHLADIQPRLERLRFYDAGGNQVDNFSFTRKIYDAAGQLIDQRVASFSAPALPAPTPVPALPAPQQQPALIEPPRPASEFAELAKKVEAVAGRVEQLENPPVVKLDKPVLRRGP